MSDPLERNVYCLLGLPFDAIDTPGAVRRIREAVAQKTPLFISTPNVNWVVMALSDTAFRDAAASSDLAVADGTPLIWIARLLRLPIRERVAGSDVFEALRRDTRSRVRVYFFGGLEGVAQRACERLNSAGAGMQCAGFHFPGLGTIESMSSEATLEKINAVNPDFVVVSLGAKKGQAWIARNRGRLNAPAVSHLGAVVDFVAGTVRRAPVWAQRAGLEWFWRVKENPALWRRYASDGMVLMKLLLFRVLPYALYLRRQVSGPDERQAATLSMQAGAGHLYVQASGAWTEDELRQLRESAKSALHLRQSLSLNMSGVTYVDAAIVGFLMLARARLSQQGLGLEIAEPSAPVRKVIRYCCAEYLLS